MNVLATFGALILASQGAPGWLAALLHFAPLPYNVFLFVAIQRARPRSGMAVSLALFWLIVVTIV